MSVTSKAASNSATLDSDVSLLEQSISHLDKTLSSLQSLALEAPWSTLGYFDAAQHDEMEHLFFRFLVSRRVLVSLALQLKTATAHDSDLQHALARADESFADTSTSTSDEGDSHHSLRTLISLAAAMALFVYEGTLVQSFAKDEIAVAKLNEEFYRSGIKRNTYNELSLECTDTTTNGRLKSLERAYLLYCEEQPSDGNNGAAQAQEDDKQAREMLLAGQIHTFASQADGLLQNLMGKKESLFLSSLNNQLRHAKVAELTRHIKDDTYRIMRQTRAHTFKGVSRLKSPTAHLIQFTEEQKKDILTRLQPGDLIFTYTAGYMSDVFIPGAFKHGITFVGSPEERAEAGLTAEGIARMRDDDMPEGEADKLLEQFGVSRVPPVSGEDKAPDADVIEAVAEGVIFNNLCRLLDTHVNRLLVLRPRIMFDERIDALIDIFRFLGDKYDFGFNFADASAVVCTEIQYHAFNGKGQLAFELTKRAGHPTLSADDICNYYLSKPESFDFVLLALEDTKSTQHQAKVYVGDDGKGALIDLMKSESK